MAWGRIPSPPRRSTTLENEVFGGRSDPATPIRTVSRAVAPAEIVVPEGHQYIPVVVEESWHETTDSWIRAMLDCRTKEGEVIVYDDPKRRMLGFIHHPDVPGVKSVYHLLSLDKLRSNPATSEALDLMGLDYAVFMKEVMGGTFGRHRMLTGRDPESPEQGAGTEEEQKALEEAMMHDGITTVSGPNGVEFPEVNLWKIPDLGFMEEDRQAEWWKRTEALKRWTSGSDWVPEGWTRFVLPYDADRVGVWGEKTEGEVYGAFLRRGEAGMLRVFEGGKWDRLQGFGARFKVAVNGRCAHYEVAVSGKCADSESAITAALSSGEPKPLPAPVVIDIPLR